MLIGIDWDKTISADIEFWKKFIALAEQHEHQCIVITGRNESQPVDILGIPVVYAGDLLKREAAENAGYNVSIWIDDQPGTIERCRKLNW